MDLFMQYRRQRYKDSMAEAGGASTNERYSDKCDHIIHSGETLHLSSGLPVIEHVRNWEYLSTFHKRASPKVGQHLCITSSMQNGMAANSAAVASGISIATNLLEHKYNVDGDSHLRKTNKVTNESVSSSSVVIALAVEDFAGLGDTSNITFRKGDHIAIVEQGKKPYWKGYVIIGDDMQQQQQQHHTGYFPCSAVRIVDGIQTEHCSYGMDSAFPLPPPLVLNESSSTSYSLVSNRNSDASVDSGRCSSHTIASSIDGKSVLGYPTVQINSNHNSCSYRHHGSLESGICRESYVSTSSSSSLGSLDEKAADERGATDVEFQMGINASQAAVAAAAVLERRGQGCPDAENLRLWLYDIKFQMYCKNLIEAGYDLGVMTRVTPEDLNAVGITNPKHRKRLKTEIGYLALPDGIPNFLPTSLLQWLRCLGLEEYQSTLMKQGYTHFDHVLDITWEDLEDIGIHKLGHQKKFTLAVERLKRLHSTSTCPLAPAASQSAANAATAHIHLHHLQQALYLQPQPLDMPHDEDDGHGSFVAASPVSTLQRSHQATCTSTTSMSRAHLFPATLHKPGATAAAAAVAAPLPPQVQLSVAKVRPPLAPKPTTKPVATVIAQPANSTTWTNTSSRTLDNKKPCKIATGGSLNKHAPPPPPKRVTSIRSASCSASPVHSPVHQRACPAIAYENAQQVQVQLHAYDCFNDENSRGPPSLDSTTSTLLLQQRNVALRRLLDVSQPTCDDSHLLAGELAEPLQLQAAQLKNNASNTSMESAFIPFANENVGTIRQRQRSAAVVANDRVNKIPIYSFETNAGSLSDGVDGRAQQQTLDESFFNKPTPPPLPPVRRDSIQDSESASNFKIKEELTNLDVICGMLEDLSSLLDREISEESYK